MWIACWRVCSNGIGIVIVVIVIVIVIALTIRYGDFKMRLGKPCDIIKSDIRYGLNTKYPIRRPFD